MADENECNCGVCCLPTIVEERDEAIARVAALEAKINELNQCYDIKRDDLIDEESESLKWRTAFNEVVAQRDSRNIALAAIARDQCEEPGGDGHVPCGCCRSHARTALRVLEVSR